MQDPLTGRPTCLRSTRLPSAGEHAALLDGHRERLRALDQLVAAAGQCGIRADQDRDFVLLPEDEVSLLENAGGSWAALGAALHTFRAWLPLVGLDLFGFAPDGGDLFEANTPQLVRVGAGVEALAFASQDGSIYKFFFFRVSGEVGAGFHYAQGEDGAIQASAVPGSYRLLLEKLRLIHEIGLATEVVGLTPEGVLIVKQPRGEPLPQGEDMSRRLPPGLIVIPSRFLRANRDHPRLYFLDGRPWLVADLHARNFVRCGDGALRVIDLVAAPWPEPPGGPLIADWLERVQADPHAGLLGPVPDADL